MAIFCDCHPLDKITQDTIGNCHTCSPRTTTQRVDKSHPTASVEMWVAWYSVEFGYIP